MGGATVAFTKNGGTSDGNIGSVTDAGNGTYAAVFTATTAGSARVIGATLNGAQVTTALPSVTVVPGPATALTSVVTVSASTVVSGNSVVLSLQAKDASGNQLTTGGATVVFSRSNGTSTGAISATTDQGNGAYTATFTGQIAGTATTISATIGGTAVTTGLPTVTVSAGVASATTSVVGVSAPTIASGSSVTLTLQTKDASGNHLTTGGATVVFSHNGGTSTGTISSTTDQGNGTYTATFTGQTAGTATTIGATVGGSAVTTALPTVSVTPGAISPATSVVTVSAPTMVAGNSVTLTLEGKDAAGNLLTIGGATVVFSRSGGSSTGTISVTTDLGIGTYTATFTGQLAGTATTIGATINGTAVSSALPTVTVVVGPVSVATSLVSVSSGTVQSGSSATLLLQAKDVGGNNITSGGLIVGFGLGTGTSDGSIGGTTDNSDGTYSAAFVGTIAGTPRTITAAIGGQPVTSALPAVTVIAGAAVILVGRPALTILAPNASGATTLLARDALGNPASTATATLTSLNPAVAQLTALTVTGTTNGVAQLEAALGGLRDTITAVVAGTGRFVGTVGAPNRDTVLAAQSRLSLDFVFDATRAAPQTLGSFTVTVSADPQVVRLDSVSIANVQNLVVNMTGASSGAVVVGGFTTTGIPANAVLFKLWVTVVGLPGQRTRITVTPQDLTETSTLVDLRPATSIADARVRIQ